MKSWKGLTQDKHLKLSESQEFKLKTWNFSKESPNWISTKLGKTFVPLDTGNFSVKSMPPTLKLDNEPSIKLSPTPSITTKPRPTPQNKQLETLQTLNSRLKHARYNDKTLVLEREKERYAELESEFKNLLGQVEKLQVSHSLELEKVKKEFKTSQNSQSVALDLKSQEVVALSRELQVWQGKYAAESGDWICKNELLKQEITKLEKDNSKFIKTLEKTSQNYEILKEKLKVENGKFKEKQDELSRFMQSYKRTEISFNKEREAWYSLKLELKETRTSLQRVKKENEILIIAQNKSNEAISQVSNVKPVLEEAKRKINVLVDREKGLLNDLEEKNRQERSLLEQITYMKQEERERELELFNLKGNYSHSIKEVEALKISNQELLDLTLDLNKKREEEISKSNFLKQEIDSLVSEKVKLEEKEMGHSRLLEEYKRQISKMQQETLDFKSSALEYYKKIESLMQEKSQLSSTLSFVQQDLHDMTTRFQQVSELLDEEKSSKALLESENSSKFSQVADRINALQATIQETSTLLSTYKKNEINTRSLLAERSEALQEKELEVLSLKNALISLKESLSTQAQEFQDLTVDRKEQLLKLSQMYEYDVKSLKSAIGKFKSELQESQKEVVESKAESTILKYENASLTQEISTLECKLQTSKSGESSLIARITSLESIIKTFESQMSVYKSKISSLESQLKIFEESDFASQKIVLKDISLGKLQEKLSNQLEFLINQEEE